jgi:hypothetical protein
MKIVCQDRQVTTEINLNVCTIVGPAKQTQTLKDCQTGSGKGCNKLTGTDELGTKAPSASVESALNTDE